jgi:hypothetical protein
MLDSLNPKPTERKWGTRRRMLDVVERSGVSQVAAKWGTDNPALSFQVVDTPLMQGSDMHSTH